jgi:hypothetical protein
LSNFIIYFLQFWFLEDWEYSSAGPVHLFALAPGIDTGINKPTNKAAMIEAIPASWVYTMYWPYTNFNSGFIPALCHAKIIL